MHDPKLLTLGKPAIGYIIVGKERIRRIIEHIYQTRGITVLLTTHVLSDVESLCKWVMIIDPGKLLYDGKLDLLRERFGEKHQSIFDFVERYESISMEGAVIAGQEGSRITFHFLGQDSTASELINKLSAQYRIRDLELR